MRRRWSSKRSTSPAGVFPAGSTCNLTLQLKNAALLRQEIAACEAKPPIEMARCATGLQYSPYGNAETYVRYIRNGIGIGEAKCIGTGSPDGSGFRFARFRCTIIVQDNLAHGRLNVVPTGRNTFHWEII